MPLPLLTARSAPLPSPATRYLDEGYLRVRGMSSLFAARIIVRLLEHQMAIGIGGHVAEIGAFEGRMLVAMAHCLAAGERALAVDHFAWPDRGVRGRLEANLANHGVADGRVVVIEADSRRICPDALRAAVGGPCRFVHVDGEHTAEHLLNDLGLATAVATTDGVVALDDMLHPGYPTLALTVHAFLDARPDWRVMAILDREDIVGAAKYLLCRTPMIDRYTAWLSAAFPTFVWPMTADFGTYRALVLTPEPRLADIG